MRSDSGLTYQVDVRDVKERAFSCTCADFRKNGLGTCKHVEAVLLQAQRKKGKAGWQSAVKEGSQRIEVVPHVLYDLQVVSGLERLPRALRGMFLVEDGTRRTSQPLPDVLSALERLRAADIPDLRISQEVGAAVAAQGDEEEHRRLRREYEQRVQGGEWPALETTVPLFPYQREGMLHLAFTKRALLADEMGLGKTIQAIAACALLHRLGKAGACWW